MQRVRWSRLPAVVTTYVARCAGTAVEDRLRRPFWMVRRTVGWFARSELRAVAPIFNPPSGEDSILSSGKRLISTTRAGVSTLSFIRSSKVVPPAMNRTSAPCCAVSACAAVSVAAPTSAGLVNSKVFIEASPGLRTFANFLDGGDDMLKCAHRSDKWCATR